MESFFCYSSPIYLILKYLKYNYPIFSQTDLNNWAKNSMNFYKYKVTFSIKLKNFIYFRWQSKRKINQTLFSIYKEIFSSNIGLYLFKLLPDNVQKWKVCLWGEYFFLMKYINLLNIYLFFAVNLLRKH